MVGDAEPPEPGGPTHPEVHHEDRDVDVRRIAVLTAWLVAVVAGTFIAMWFIHRALVAYQMMEDPPVSPVFAEAPKLPPEPRLQADPALDMRDMRAAEDQMTETYGWVDRDQGVVRLPLDRAIELLAERGLPVRAEPPPPPAPEVVVPRESSLGGPIEAMP